jgi:hypothetical protein
VRCVGAEAPFNVWSVDAGLSLVYAIGTSLFGGTTQFVVTWLLAVTHNPMAPAWYVVVMCAVGTLAMWMLPESRDVDVNR